MKIAVSGAHRTGKTTLIDELAASLPTFVSLDEPYYQLAEIGHGCAEMPGVEEFELQLEHSIESILENDGDCLFDRCPADLLAYLIALGGSDAADVDRWLARVRDAMERLDLVVFVPIEDPDRVSVPASDNRSLRRRVHDELVEILLEERWAFDVPVLEVTGSRGDRARQVLAHLRGT